MNAKSKTISIAAIAAAVAVFNFQSCKKYDDGPAISLKSKKGRLTGEWELTGGDPGIYDPTISQIWEFEKDGDFKWTYSYTGYSYSYQGDWEWENNKEEIELTFTGGGISEFVIKRLTNKELTIEGPSPYKYEW